MCVWVNLVLSSPKSFPTISCMPHAINIPSLHLHYMCKIITGIKCNNNEFLLTQYVDDTSVLLDGSETSLRSTSYVLKCYADVSGLCLNVDKTKAIWIGSLKGRIAVLCPDLNLTRENETFNLLGVTFSINLADMVDLNYSKQIEHIESLFKCYSKRF